ncbi:TRAP transporter substrate-binding protein [Chloroflexota bacterium]
MKKLVLFLAALILVGVMPFFACAPAPIETITWTVGSLGGAGHPVVTSLEEMAALLLERTGGKFTWEVHRLGELGYAGPDILPAIETGALTAGEYVGDYYTGLEPILATPALPFLSTPEQIPLKLDTVRPMIQETLDNYNQTILLLWEYPNILWSQIEIKTIDDFEKIKIRSSSPNTVAAMTKLGGTGMTLPSAEVYQALATKMVNAVEFSVEAGKNYGFHEVTDFTYLSPVISGSSALFVVNNDAYNALPSDVRKVLDDIIKEYNPIVIDRVRLVTPELRAEIGKMSTVHDSLPPQVVAQLREKGAIPIWNDWLAKHPETKPLLDAVKSALGISR